MISVNTNMPALVGLNVLARTQRGIDLSVERLATGQRINRASDDPGGMIATEDLKARERTLRAQIDSLEQQSAQIAARDGAVSVIADLIQDLRSSVLAAANRGGLSEAERRGLQENADSILQTIDYLANTSTFKGQQLISGLRGETLGRVTSPGGPSDGGSAHGLSLADLMSGRALNLISGDLEGAQKAVDAAVESMTSDRGAAGNLLKGLDSKRRTLQVELENVSAAKSAILDTDYAKEVAELVRQQVLRQAALYSQQLAMKQKAEIVMSLLK